MANTHVKNIISVQIANPQYIHIIKDEENSDSEDLLLQRRSYGGIGLGVGAPTICKCPNCGYESPKTQGVPCSNNKCPECETPLCGAE